MGRRLVALEQVRGERILLMHFDEDVSLLFELMPKRANVMLIEGWNREERTGRVLQSFRRASLETGGVYRIQEAPATLSAASQDSREFEMEEGAPFPYHQAVGKKYWAGVQKTGFSAYQKLWRQTWKSHSRKVKTALDNVKKDFEEAREAEAFQKKGMALVAHLFELGAK